MIMSFIIAIAALRLTVAFRPSTAHYEAHSEFSGASIR
jgi:hypothetical protein